jgi:hypothetical protein
LECLQRLISIFSVDNPQVHLILLLLPSPSDSLQSSTNGNGSSFANLLSKSDSLRQCRLARSLQDIRPIALVLGEDLDKAIGNAEEVSLRGSDSAAREDEIAGAGEANEGGQAESAASAGDYTETSLRQTDGGVGGEDAEVGGEGELEAAAECDGGDGGDCRDLEVGEAGEGAAEVGEELSCSVGAVLASQL